MSSGLSAGRVWVRLPNWLGDVVMALPLLRALKADSPDTELTLVGKSAFAPLVERLAVADRFVALPPKGAGYYRAFYRRRAQRPDRYLLLTRSLRGDLEAWLAGGQRRLGLVRPGDFRPLLTDAFKLPADTDLTAVHQTTLWERMARYFGVEAAFDYAPLHGTAPRSGARVGLICGSENSPEKRWPVASWRGLVERLLTAQPGIDIALYGTPGDREITDRVCADLDSARVVNRAGETDLPAFCDALAGCAVVCCNDTGGMHLANVLGSPVVALFGPTNPVRTGPAFAAPRTVLQPDGCPATGGAPIENIGVDRCAAAVLAALSAEG
ncbi:MAG: glycosyltransferase family 9 protein [Pseudomonadota bacterium]